MGEENDSLNSLFAEAAPDLRDVHVTGRVGLNQSLDDCSRNHEVPIHAALAELDVEGGRRRVVGDGCECA